MLAVGPSPYIGIAFTVILGSTSRNRVGNVGLLWETENKESITSNISNYSKMLSTKNWRGVKEEGFRFQFFFFAVAIWPVTGQGFQNTKWPAVRYNCFLPLVSDHLTHSLISMFTVCAVLLWMYEELWVTTWSYTWRNLEIVCNKLSSIK